uniref:Methylaspartate mutase subunit E n=1 Tax=candidate division WOR-3 bacterium TaxID=2052148 RepID=A0A7C2P8H6_UNCW3
MQELRNERLSQEEFLKERKNVLSQWPTGREVDLDEAIEYHYKLPPMKNIVRKLRHAKEHGEIYATSGMGKATIEEQLELYKYVEKEGQADILGLSVDSLTRQNNYEKAEQKWRESKSQGVSLLNGLPVVNVGVKGIRTLVEAVNCPIQPRYGAADARLCDEILIAGGCSSSAPDVFMDFWHHHGSVSLEYVIKTHQYCSRLLAYYEENGVPTLASSQGLYGAGIAPSLQIAHQIISILIQVEQGVKNLGVMTVGHGNLVQDVAAARARKTLIEKYLSHFGYHDIEIFFNVSFNLMEYPVHVGVNLAVVFMNTLMAKLTNSQLNDIRTLGEAKAIPTKEEIAFSFRSAKAMQNFLRHQKIFVDENAVQEEQKMIEKEAECILNKVLEMGDGDVVRGAIRAVEQGVLDHPFAANRAAKGLVICVKDNEGAVRYLEKGNLPFDKEILEYHREKIKEREYKKGRRITFDDVISDLYAVSKGILVE